MKKIICFYAFFVCAIGVSAQQISAEIPENALVYALPQTTIEISVEVVKDCYLPGPYAKFAELYLSIENTGEREETSYSVGKVSIKPFIEADYNSLYALSGTKDETQFLTLSSQGLIFALNEPDEVLIDLSSVRKNYQHYPDQLPTSPMTVQNETIFDRIKTDSGYISVPYQESIVNKKDIQSKAEEAAKFLFALRRRRFELITGDVEHAFNGSSLKDAVQEINRLESEYLSLFIGKHFTESREYKFYVTPESARDKKAYLVFHFSESEGILSETSRTSTPFMLNVEPKGKIDRIEGIKSRTKVANIYYRVPETAFIQLMRGSKELCSGMIHVYQMGKEFMIPSNTKTK